MCVCVCVCGVCVCVVVVVVVVVWLQTVERFRRYLLETKRETAGRGGGGGGMDITEIVTTFLNITNKLTK